LVCWVALICSVPCILLDGQGNGIFLARLYVSDDEFIFSRLVFVPLFAAVAFVAFLRSNILYRKGVSP
jgi:hypothetical protein